MGAEPELLVEYTLLYIPSVAFCFVRLLNHNYCILTSNNNFNSPIIIAIYLFILRCYKYKQLFYCWNYCQSCAHALMFTYAIRYKKKIIWVVWEVLVPYIISCLFFTLNVYNKPVCFYSTVSYNYWLSKHALNKKCAIWF